jgi:hypothetical protein
MGIGSGINDFSAAASDISTRVPTPGSRAGVFDIATAFLPGSGGSLGTGGMGLPEGAATGGLINVTRSGFLPLERRGGVRVAFAPTLIRLAR